MVPSLNLGTRSCCSSVLALTLTCLGAACSPKMLTAIGPVDGGGGGMDSPGGKRGVAYGFKTTNDLSAVGPSVSWWYNWATQPDQPVRDALPSLGIEFVPMVWGKAFDVQTVAKQIPVGAQYLLAFNEPNFASQANLTPEQAAALWPQLEELATQRNLQLVSPALNYCGGGCNETNPFTWLEKFFAACKGCRVDYIALHWYACTKSALQSYLSDYKAKFSKPLWLTEFSCLDDASISDAKEAGYLQDALGVLENDPIVFRYSWFTGRFDNKAVVNLLGSGDGALTPLGQAYAAYPSRP
jgi:hypothetical protein